MLAKVVFDSLQFTKIWFYSFIFCVCDQVEIDFGWWKIESWLFGRNRHWEVEAHEFLGDGLINVLSTEISTSTTDP
jgi:hypothetical protein